jgi:hypothetical protein
MPPPDQTVWTARFDEELRAMRMSGESFENIGLWFGCSGRAAMLRYKHLTCWFCPLTAAIVHVSGPYPASVDDATRVRISEMTRPAPVRSASFFDRADGHEFRPAPVEPATPPGDGA